MPKIKKGKLENIKVRKQSPADEGWLFIVEVGEEERMSEHTVMMDRDYWQKLTKGVGAPADLIKKSFEFLLRREAKESILKNFNLRDIKKYFSDYERVIAPAEPYLEARPKK